MIAKALSRDVFVPSPSPRVGVMGGSYYSTLDGQSLVSLHTYTSRSDTADIAFVRFSEDGGRTWSEPNEWAMKFDHANGTGRRHPRGGYVDPRTGRYLEVWTEGVLPTDDPLEGMKQWELHYLVSDDGRKTVLIDEQIIHEGEVFDEVHHLPGVTVGRNCVMMGDRGERPLTRSDGVILLPVQSSPTGPDGDYFNPGAGYTYTDCLLLLGRWKDGASISWTASERVVGDPERTTRGLVEPTIAELDDGSILMVMRGSNDARPALPGHKWEARSHDGGQNWTTPEPWRYDRGEPFYSPSACSQLVPHSDGRLFWMGNICSENPRGNSPRYPIILGEVDTKTGLLIRDSVTVIDDRQPGESERLTLSNFYAREDRETGELLLFLPRFFAKDAAPEGKGQWGTDLSLYRIELL